MLDALSIVASLGLAGLCEVLLALCCVVFCCYTDVRSHCVARNSAEAQGFVSRLVQRRQSRVFFFFLPEGARIESADVPVTCGTFFH